MVNFVIAYMLFLGTMFVGVTLMWLLKKWINS
jgi:hypothetical protein